MNASSQNVECHIKLGEIATYVNGYAFKPSDYSSKEGDPIIRIQDLTGNSYETNKFSGNLPDKYRVNNGDILVSWSASLGVYEWTKGPAWLNQHIFKVVFDKKPINKNFFIHQARHIIENSGNLAHGATMRHLTKKVFDALPFYYPGPQEQQQIADQLDKLSAIIDTCQTINRKLENLVKSRFIEMFGDPNHSHPHEAVFLEDAFDIRDDLRKPLNSKTRSDMKAGELYPYYGANGIVDYINSFITDCDALCFAEDCGSYGADEQSTYIVRGKAWVNNHAHFLLAKPCCVLEWANVFFCLLDIGKMISGTTRSKLTQAQLKRITINLPPLALQQEFAAFVSQVDKLRFATQQQIDKLETLKESLMQEYFG